MTRGRGRVTKASRASAAVRITVPPGI